MPPIIVRYQTPWLFSKRGKHRIPQYSSRNAIRCLSPIHKLGGFLVYPKALTAWVNRNHTYAYALQKMKTVLANGRLPTDPMAYSSNYTISCLL